MHITSKASRVNQLIVVVIGLVLVATACGTNGGETGEGRGPAGQSVDTRVLRIGAQPDDHTVDPPNKANVTMMFGANASVVESLTVAGPDLSVRPLLATEWTFTAPATWRIQLRPGVTFHNDSPFNAEAVAANLNGRLAGGSVVGLTATSATAIDTTTVEVVTDPPNSRLMHQLAHPTTGIVAPGTSPGAGTSAENTPTGTGPYRFVSYTPKSELRVRRNDSYWGTKPAFDEMLFRYMPDGNARVLALKAGDVDAIYDVPREQVSSLQNDRSVKIVKSVTGAHQSLYLNLKGDPPHDLLRDLELRKAVAHAINADAIVKNVWPGGAEPMRTLIPTSLLGPDASAIKGHDHDPAQARRILDQAGWTPGSDGVRTKGGRRLELTMQVYLPDEQRPLPELVKAQLAEIGVAVDVKVPADSTTYFATVRDGQGDIFAEGSASGVEHPLGPGTFFRSASTSYGRWMSPGETYDSLYRQAFSAATETDFRRASAQMMRILVDESVVVIPIAGVFRIYGLSPKLKGLEPSTFIYSQRWHTVTPA